MSKLKQWLYLKFLPDWCRSDLMEANQHFAKVILEQKHEIDRLNAYIDGFETAMRSQRRVIIKNEVSK